VAEDRAKLIAAGYDRVAEEYLRLEQESEWPRLKGEWLRVPMFFSCYPPETTERIVREAGFEFRAAEVEVQTERTTEIPYLWVLRAAGGT
jgi:hypothetical protein